MLDRSSLDESLVGSAARAFANAVSDGRLEDAEKALVVAFGVAALGGWPGAEPDNSR
jgi:hypothetical protein